MKKVLIVGKTSYIGTSFEQYARDRFDITMVSSRDNEWEKLDFAAYDSVLFVAGIAHRKQTKDSKNLYFEVNRDLAVKASEKAKSEGAGQFIYLSSMAVYGAASQVIDENTTPVPNTGDFYGSSKYQAELELKKTAADSLRLCIVRPPMVYGKRCKGNFPKLVKLVRMTPVFSDYPNKRSMIYIDFLCNFLCGLIEQGSEGIFLPHNSEYVNTTALARSIAAGLGKRLHTTRAFNPLIRLFSRRFSACSKLFGDLCYAMQGDEAGYCDITFEESVRRSVEAGY